MVFTFMMIIVSIVRKVENNQVNQYMCLWVYGNSQTRSKLEKTNLHSLTFNAKIQNALKTKKIWNSFGGKKVQKYIVLLLKIWKILHS